MITLYNTDAITEICTLDDCLECLVTEEENGVFELELTYSIASNNFSDIQNNRVVKAKASDELGEQLFRIYYVSNEINGKIYVKAQHITYDLMDNFVEGVTCTKSTCEQSFQTMLSKCVYEHNFKGYSDIEHTATYNLNRVNPLEAILGTKGSLLDTYGNGAKLKRDNYNIYLNKSRGSNNGVTIAYSKNITGYKREIDETGVITCIYPFAKVQRELGEGDSTTTIEETIVLPERFVNSKYINNYPNPKILAVDYSEREVKDIESLRTQANKYFQETSKDIPNVNYKVEFVYLHQTTEYEDNNLKALELVGMGDTVTVIDERIGMNVEANVIKTVFNVLTDRYESIELGRFKGSINDIIGDLEANVDNALNQVNNMYTNFEVLDDKIVSEVSRLEGDVKASTSLWQQEANSITSTVKDLNGKYTQLKQTVDGIDITGKVSFYDLRTAGATVINGSNITTGTIDTNRVNIKSGTTKKIVIANDNYCVYDGSETDVNRKVFMGFRTNTATNVPSVMLGYNGINPSVDGAVVSGGTYTTYSHYPNNDNPEGVNQSYGALAFKYGAAHYQFSTLNMYQNGDVDLKSGASMYFRPNLRDRGNHAFAISDTSVGCRVPFKCTSSIYTNGDITTDVGLGSATLHVTGQATVGGILNVKNGAIYGMNNIALSRSQLYIPNFGGNTTMDYIRLGGGFMGVTDGGAFHFITNGASRSITLASGTVYLPQGGGNNNAEHARFGAGIMACPSSGSFHFLTANGSATRLYASNVTSAYSLEPVAKLSNRSVFDEINSVEVVDTTEGFRLMDTSARTLSTEKSATSSVYTTYNEKTEQEEVNIDYTTAISTLWKAVQELKVENEELKNEVKTLKGVDAIE